MAIEQDSSTAEIGRWDPDKDASQPRCIEGRLVEYRSFETAYGDLLCVTIEDDNGTVWSRKINNASLEREVSEKEPLPGEHIRIDYFGKTPVRSGPYEGSMAHSFKVTVAGRAPIVPDFKALRDGKVVMSQQQQPQLETVPPTTDGESEDPDDSIAF